MARIVSFIVLVAILLVIAALFFQVMANFLLPLFLALLLVIMFDPVHGWFLARCRGRQRMAAGLTTATILLIVLAPLSVVLVQAVSESITVYHGLEPGQLDIEKLTDQTAAWGNRLGLDLNPADLRDTVTQKTREWLYPVAKSTGQFLGSFLMGLIVMIVSLYYFLSDGPQMVRAITRLSPLDECYKEQLVDQFVTVSRAVVLATLLSAVAQGVLAGLGLWLAGFSAVFLLTVAAMLLSMVPFVGPPAIWVPAVLWLYFVDGRTGAAVALAIYGTIIISSVDNIIKPAVLHGRSNLHPLLALLSVLGGVQTMGLIGIFVGPMAVAFLQTLLNILHNELETMKVREGAAGTPSLSPHA
jgi:predicted PurR-regulated permease PerM